MAGFVSHIRATQVSKRRATEQSGAARDFKQDVDTLACASYRQAKHRRYTPCRQAKPQAHPKATRTNPNLQQKDWLKTRHAIQRHGQAEESAGMNGNGHLFLSMATTFPSTEIAYVSI